MFRKILVQCEKELLQFKRDRLTVALAFLLPFLTLLIYGFAIRLESKNIPIVIQDLEQSPLSRDFAARLLVTNQLVPAKPPLSEQVTGRLMPWSFEEALGTDVAKVGIIIPPDFTKRIRANQQVQIQVLVDGSDVVNARVVANSIRGFTAFYNATHRFGANDVSTSGPRITSDIRIWFNPGRKESLYIVPGDLAVILGLFPAILMAISMVRETEEGNIVQVYAANLHASELLLGKWLAYLLVGLGEAIFSIGLGMIIFHLSFVGDPSPFFVGTPIFIGDTVMFGLMVGVFVTNQSAAIQMVGTSRAMLAILLSGFLYPLSNIPFPFSLFSYLVSTRYYMELIRSTFVRGSGWGGSWTLLPMMLALMLIEYWIAWHHLRPMQLSSKE
jgi:ABC-2 type transport system permease protein